MWQLKVVDADLAEDRLHRRARHHPIQEAVEVVAARAVPERAEGRHARRARDVPLLLALDGLLREHVAGREADERRHRLDDERLRR